MELVQSYFKTVLNLELVNLCDLGIDYFLADCELLVNEALSSVSSQNCFDVDRVFEVLYYLFCLVRGVKNKKSVLCIKKFYVEVLTTSKKARKFKSLMYKLLTNIH